MNLILLMVLVSELCLGLCAWLSPGSLRWIAAHLLTRADVIEVAKKEHKRRIQFWENELGVDQRESEVHPLAAVPSLLRR